MSVRAVRGAITLDADTPEQIQTHVADLVGEILRRNDLTAQDVISALVTATDDVHSAHPAASVRRSGLADVPIMGARELEIVDGLQLCIRLMLHVDSKRSAAQIRHVFLRGATVLRPDLDDSND